MRSGKPFVHCIVAALLTLPVVSAFADDGKTRYVSGSGKDEGECLNKFRPCRTLQYAIARAGKADIVHVAEGEYSARNTADLSQLLAMNGRLNAGFNKSTGFTDRNAIDRTILIGIPPSLRERYEAAGFTVISDIKSLDTTAVAAREESQRMRTLAAQITATEGSHAVSACVNNTAAGYPCNRLSLLAHVPLSQLQPASPRGNDVWGFTDLNTGREYAFMGVQNGLAVLDVTNPEMPDQLVYATGSQTTWRDIKIYQRYDLAAKRWRAYAYVSADAVNDYTMVLDLSELPNTIERVNTAFDFRGAHNLYMVNADYSFGLAEQPESPRLGVSGASAGSGNHRMYSLEQPRTPTLRHGVNIGYSHDLSSFAISDARKNTQCINAASAAKCEVLADFNVNSVDLWDITNPTSPALLAQRTYPFATYVHSGWWTEDGRYVFVHDEQDEQAAGLNTTVRILDVSNLRNPFVTGTWTGTTRAIDHNGFVKGNRYYVANYSQGLTVLDITNPSAPTTVGFFDTYPTADMAYVGAWGAYPFFASGTVAVSDINSGLYLLRNETLDTPNGTFAFTTSVVSGSEGQQLTLTVSRASGSTGTVSVELHALHASTSASDAALSTQLLTWANGDTTDKSFTVTLNNDASNEPLELLLVRLKNPQGGATINYPDTAYVRIADSGAETRFRLLNSTVNVNEVRGRALVMVTRQGSAVGAASVSFNTNANTSYTAFTPQTGTINWADGDTSAKAITIDFDPNRLQPGQTGTFQVQLAAPNLENDSGATVATMTATVNVYDPPPPPPPADPVPERRGGGPIDSLWLVILASLAVGSAVSRNRRIPDR